MPAPFSLVSTHPIKGKRGGFNSSSSKLDSVVNHHRLHLVCCVSHNFARVLSCLYQ